MRRTELPCAKYKIHDCVHEPALHCIRMYSAYVCTVLCALCMKSIPMHVKELLLSPLLIWTLCRPLLKQAQEVLKECLVHADHFTLRTVPVRQLLWQCKNIVVKDSKSTTVSFRVRHYFEQEHVPVGQRAQTAAKLLIPLLGIECQCCSMH